MAVKEVYKRLQPKRSKRVRWLVGMSLLMMCVAIGVMFYQTFNEYRRSYNNAQSEALRLAAIVSEHVDQNIRVVDLLLQHAVERQHMNLLFGGRLPQDIVHNFKLWVDSTPQTVAMMLINEHGQAEIAVNSKEYSQWIDYQGSFEDFLPFAILREDDTQSHVVMPYQTTRDTSLHAILVARRMSKLDGTFGGAVIAVVNADFFLDYFQSIDSGEQHHIDLLMEDGKSIFDTMNHDRLWQGGSDVWRSILENQQDSLRNAMIYRGSETIKVLAYQKLDDLPLTAVVSIDEASFLDNFWDDRFKDLSFLLLIVLFGSIGSFFIITLSKQIMRVEKSEASAILASQAKSEFLANMSHELRTPLNAIIGFSEMMTAGYFGPMNSKQKERMADITLCGNHLLHLINDILEFSKGEAGRLEIIEEKVSIPSIIDETLRIMNEKVKSKGVKLVVDVKEEMPVLFADKRKLKQVLINLVSNAIKFTPPEGTISLRAHQDNSGNIIIEVSDTGIGIAEEDIPTALAVFGQVHRSQSHEGTGLGLPLCRMFTELHGGSLTLTSALGEGTTVRLQFPQARAIVQDQVA